LLWQEWTNPEDRPLWERRDELIEEHGEEMANFMVNVSRNLCLYPNVYLMDQFSTQIRHFRPISVDKTEVTIYAFAPKGEPADARAARIRQYEDFFNASGMATPDDLEEFRASQKAYQATAARWNDMSRGQTHQIDGPDEQAKALGMNPISSGARTEDEGLFPIQHAYWQEVMTEAIAEENAN
jgi:benzoate/toluate 1,2-dioxygenase alpha subunit